MVEGGKLLNSEDQKTATEIARIIGVALRKDKQFQTKLINMVHRLLSRNSESGKIECLFYKDFLDETGLKLHISELLNVIDEKEFDSVKKGAICVLFLKLMNGRFNVKW